MRYPVRLRVFTLMSLLLLLLPWSVAGAPLPTNLASTECANLSWEPATPMLTPRWLLGVAESGGEIYAAGGADQTVEPIDYISQKLEAYDPATNAWERRADMLFEHVNFGIATATNGKIYVVGGDHYNSWVSTVEEYDPTTDTWQFRKDMPTARVGVRLAAASNGRLYAIGGIAGYYTPLQTVEEYDPASDTWVSKSDMPTARCDVAAVTASNGRIYAIGGHTSNDVGSHLRTVEEYDPTANTWRTRASMPTARSYLTAVATPTGKIYAIGGYGLNGVWQKAVEEYDIATDQWLQCTNLPRVYSHGGGAFVGGCIYLVGGFTLTDVADTPLMACVDTTPPTLSVTAFPSFLWPPNHQYATVQVTTNAVDESGGFCSVHLVSVVSNEPDDGVCTGDLPNDIQIVDEHTFLLRAERSDSGRGRVYTITYQATDEAGNATLASAEVVVAHDKRAKE